jgi:dienelactone hydrolase
MATTLALVAGCTASRPATSTGGRPRTSGRLSINVEPSRSLLGEPVHVRVRGAAPGARVRLRAETADVHGRRWVAQASFVADRGGGVDLDASAPVVGDYQGVAGMGLLWSLRPPAGAPAGTYFEVAPNGQAVGLRAVSGAETATATFLRLARATGVTSRTLTLARDGLVGAYHAPAGGPPGPGVLLFGGSSGGMADAALLAMVLASHGYRALALAYFRAPGLPDTLSAIPLEYFQTALRWLAGRPGVRAHRLVVAGWSRGSEAALLLGVHDPATIRGVVALAPNDTALCSYPGCAGPAWTLGGRPVPFTRQFNTPAPTDVPGAVIPVERVNGPLFLACGGHDQVWASCEFMRAIVARRASVRGQGRDVALRYPQAGHGIAFPIPYLPTADAAAVQGATPEANEHAREAAWPRLLRYLAMIG